MVGEGMNTQKIFLNDLNDDGQAGGRKAYRIELRTLRDAYNLKTTGSDALLTAMNNGSEESTPLRRTTAYCTAEAYNLKNLCKLLRGNVHRVDKIQMYFGECLSAVYKVGGKSYDIFFLHYGVVVMWGLEENEEQNILKMIGCVEENAYDMRSIEVEKFSYGIGKNAQIVNDKIFLTEENTHIKMVISIAMAQSVKLDYFEELVDSTIETVKDLPDEVEKDGKVGKRRQDILRVMGKLHKLSFNLYLVSDILGEPEIIWEYSCFSPLYETCLRYLDIKPRADLLNKRCEIIHGMLEILSENITTHNSEKLERTMTILIGISAIFGLLQFGLLLIATLLLYIKWF